MMDARLNGGNGINLLQNCPFLYPFFPLCQRSVNHPQRLLSCFVPPMKGLQLHRSLALLVRLQPRKIEPAQAAQGLDGRS